MFYFVLIYYFPYNLINRNFHNFHNNPAFFIIYKDTLFWKGFFIFYFVYIFFMMETHFWHKCFLYYSYIIREDNEPLFQVNTWNCKAFSYSYLPEAILAGPPKTIFFYLYTYHSQK